MAACRQKSIKGIDIAGHYYFILPIKKLNWFFDLDLIGGLEIASQVHERLLP
jgi:hypothetical protein